MLLGPALKTASYLSWILFPCAVESLARAACQSFSDHRLVDEHQPFDEEAEQEASGIKAASAVHPPAETRMGCRGK